MFTSTISLTKEEMGKFLDLLRTYRYSSDEKEKAHLAIELNDLYDKMSDLEQKILPVLVSNKRGWIK